LPSLSIASVVWDSFLGRWILVAMLVEVEKVKIVFGAMLSFQRHVEFVEESDDVIMEEYGMVEWSPTREFVVVWHSKACSLTVSTHSLIRKYDAVCDSDSYSACQIHEHGVLFLGKMPDSSIPKL
jgi:hypothetical protein